MVASSFILFDVRVPRNPYVFMFEFCRVSLHNFCVRSSLLFVIRSSFLLIGVRTCATADVVHNVCVRDNRFVYTYLWGGKLFSVCRTIWLRSHFFLFLLAGNIDNVFCWLVVCVDGTHNMYSVSHPFPVSHRQRNRKYIQTMMIECIYSQHAAVRMVATGRSSAYLLSWIDCKHLFLSSFFYRVDLTAEWNVWDSD